MPFSNAGWLAAVAIGCVSAASGFGQPPAFDAVSVKAVNLATHPVFGNTGGPGTVDPGRIHLCCVGMFSLLMRAYDVELDQIIGPAWIMENMGPNLYQVDATMPAGTTKAQFQIMMQSLLAERFHLRMHRETRKYPGYELVVAKGGANLSRASGSSNLPPGPQMVTSLGRGMVRVQVQEKPIADLVKGLGRLIAQSLGADPADFSSRKARVIDKTGLAGTYDFTLEFSCERCRGLGVNAAMASEPSDSAGSELPNIFGAMEKQLGLKLVPARDIPLDVIVVDRVDKVPTGN